MITPSETTGAASATAVEPEAFSLKDVVVSHELLCRRVRKRNDRAEISAMHDLAKLMPQGVPQLLKRLAQMAVELCDADSGGVSMLEPEDHGEQFFRWVALAGALESHVGGTTPRNWSPCGECLNAGKPMLYSYPARFFTYFQRVDTVIVEGLVIPMVAADQPLGTIWIVTHNEKRKFDAEDVRIMTSLGSFVAATLQQSVPIGITDKTEAGRLVVWAEFVRRIARGDPSALESLIEETRPFVFARALRILSCPADAEEATADVFSQVWATAVRYDPHRQCVLVWLLNIARSRAIDHLRRRVRHGQRLEIAVSLCPSPAPDPETSAASRESTNRIRLAMESLPFKQRQAIKLAYFDGYSMSEIASRLGHPLGSVKTRIRLGLIAMRLLIATSYVVTAPCTTGAQRGKSLSR